MLKARASCFLENLIAAVVGRLLGSIRGGVMGLSNLIANCQILLLGGNCGPFDRLIDPLRFA
jgi:hypothetical protein